MTWGHVRLVEQIAQVFPQVVVAIGVNPGKSCLFTLDERVELAQRAVGHLPNVKVQYFGGLLTRFLAEQRYNVVIRGLRGGKDMDDNFLQELFAWSQHEGVGVLPLYMPPKPGEAFISSSLLKAALVEQADATGLAPLPSIHAVQAKMLGQLLVGVTGPSGAGKTHVCQKLCEIGEARGIPTHHIDIDKLVHQIYEVKQEPIYAQVRADIIAHFGPEVAGPNGNILRKPLAEKAFASAEARAFLESVIYGPLLVLLRQTLRSLKGLVLVDAPTLAEAGWLKEVNNNLLLVAADTETTATRLKDRYESMSELCIRRRQSAQLDHKSKEDLIQEAIQQDRYGSLVKLENGGDGAGDAEIEKAFDALMANVDIFHIYAE
jgi:pantetheine-phosphate adenylyltransferase